MWERDERNQEKKDTRRRKKPKLEITGHDTKLISTAGAKQV